MKAILFGILLLSVVLNVWMAKSLIRLENVENVAMIGTCVRMLPQGDPTRFIEYRRCTDATETRSGWLAHLWHGLTE